MSRSDDRFQKEVELVRREQSQRPGRSSLLRILHQVSTIDEAKDRLRFFAAPLAKDLCWALNQLEVEGRWTAARAKAVFFLP